MSEGPNELEMATRLGEPVTSFISTVEHHYLVALISLAIFIVILFIGYYFLKNVTHEIAKLPQLGLQLLGAVSAVFNGEIFTRKMVRLVLSELGYDYSSQVRLIEANTRKHFDQLGIDENSARIRLVRVIQHCSIDLGLDIHYGQATPQRSRYYLDTIGGAHDAMMVQQMALLLNFLLSKRPSGSLPIDFVLVPKTGNVLLGHEMTRIAGYDCVFRKADPDSSRLKSGEVAVDQHGARVNLEGLGILLEKSKSKKRSLYGVAIDCNCSGGTSIINAIAEYNAIASQNSDKLKVMNKVFVLYRPDRSALSTTCIDGIDVQFERFFDFDEAQKGRLLLLKSDKDFAQFARELTICEKETA